MDIFQLIGDFLHLMAVVMLILKILANRNVVGMFLLIHRSLLQNTIDVSSRLPNPLHRFIFRVENPIPFPHESHVYRLNCLHYVSDAHKKTILLELRPISRLLPTLLPIPSLSVPSCDHS